MPTNFLWAGAGAYSAGPTNLLTTELNSLAITNLNTLSTLGAAFQNTGGWIYADVEFIGASAAFGVGAFMELWLLRSLDGGTNYEDGSATSAPGRAADIIIPVRNVTAAMRSGASGLILPPGFFKPIARNQTGVALAASANSIRYSLYTQQY